MMQNTQNKELFSDISTENSATINGGHGCVCHNYRSSRIVNYGYGRGDYYYVHYNRPIRYGYRPSGYRYSYVNYPDRGCY
ncbi:MAG: hypothetical protein O4861_23945 [Trichodesmium sp. St16_bin4-tuft]|nr:hypothetical protein [Trichodesmium sp. MAG_R01]MDE5069695.1 hypothetical protein [Trichodesmium sp. St4_bin8_1]MDE5071041.1 hypothetical protein [Trichodesmium sp. St5_bin8]MDE5077596.1 hypothetical protein [Trichodesmium sp. St2_bin6]MDE5101213.1 hypothetical protein [Trichodesmium sp. St16_bin4-tuft]MDE5101731.1 hypothetical protein [Trichodesmium sp. St19_bin2]